MTSFGDILKEKAIYFGIGLIVIILLITWLLHGGIGSIASIPGQLLSTGISNTTNLVGSTVKGVSSTVGGIVKDAGSKQTKKNVNSIGNSLSKLGHL